MGEGRHLPQALELRIPLLEPALVVGVGIGPGVQLDHRGADAGGGLDLAAVGGDEDRDAAARLAQRRDEMGEPVLLLRHLQTALGGALLALFGDDAHGVGAVAQRDGLHLVGGGHLEVQRHRERAHQGLDVGVGDVAAILAQMGGDAVAARGLGDLGGLDRVGMGAAAGVADGGDVVDVHAQTQAAEGFRRGHRAGPSCRVCPRHHRRPRPRCLVEPTARAPRPERAHPAGSEAPRAGGAPAVLAACLASFAARRRSWARRTRSFATAISFERRRFW